MAKLKNMRATLNKVGKSGLLIGVGSILNIIPVYGKSTSNIMCHPDTHVLKSDWKMIGGDFNNAIKKIKK
jgi:hypothetical protein